jgi:retron-type reverse transcriptase
MVLEAIYEPYCELRNRAFGFRPNKSTHHAIAALTNRYKTTGLHTAIEGDISAAYDNVNKDKLIDILKKKIQDNKFFQLIRSRLDYIYFDCESRKEMKTEEGIPQGGIDSPYLFNIYMMEFDEFVHNELQSYLDDLNKGKDNRTIPLTKAGVYLKNKRFKLRIKI